MKLTKMNGKLLLGCFPLYPPVELFHAMGFTPLLLWGVGNEDGRLEESDRHLQTYSCSVARRLVQFILTSPSGLLDALFMYNACDTLRNLPEILAAGLAERGRPLPLIRMHLPAVFPDQVDASGYLQQQVAALIEVLEQAGGRPFEANQFQQSARLYGRIRALSLQLESKVAAGELSYVIFSQQLLDNCFLPAEEQLANLEALIETSAPLSVAQGGIKNGRVVISGIMAPPAPLINLIESAELVVAGNDVAMQRRSYGFQPEITADPCEYYRNFYYNHNACPTLLYTAGRRVEELLRYVKKTGAEGVIFIGEKFCEYEYFEFPYLTRQLKEEGIQTLILELSAEETGATGAFQTRVEAFAEMLISS